MLRFGLAILLLVAASTSVRAVDFSITFGTDYAWAVGSVSNPTFDSYSQAGSGSVGFYWSPDYATSGASNSGGSSDSDGNARAADGIYGYGESYAQGEGWSEHNANFTGATEYDLSVSIYAPDPAGMSASSHYGYSSCFAHTSIGASFASVVLRRIWYPPSPTGYAWEVEVNRSGVPTDKFIATTGTSYSHSWTFDGASVISGDDAYTEADVYLTHKWNMNLSDMTSSATVSKK